MARQSPKTRTKAKARERGGRDNGRRAAHGVARHENTQEALRESEERFRATFEQAAVGVAHTTTEGRFLQANSKLCQMLGYSSAELLALTTRDLTHPDDRDKHDALRLELFAGRRLSFAGEKRYLRKDGSEIWANRTVTLARRAASGERYLIQVIEDISERKRTEARLERLTRAQRVMAECNHLQIHATAESGMLESICRIMVESGGYKMAWVGLPTGDPARPVYPAAHAGFGEDVPMTGAAWGSDGRYHGFMHDVITKGEPHIARDILRDPKHERRRARAAQHGFQSSIALPLRSGGSVLGAIALYAREPNAFDADEITLLTELVDDVAFGVASQRTRVAREQAEKSSRDSERRFRETFEQAAVGISRVDLNGFLVDVNQKFCAMLGYTKDELIGKAIRDITHPEDYGQGSQYRGQLTHGAMKSATGEKRFVRKDGSVMWAQRTMSTACDDAGNPQYVISVVEDITERKESAERYRATFDNAPVGIMHTAITDDRILHANAKLSEMLGYSHAELVRMATDDFVHPEYVGADQPKYRERMLNGEVDTFSSERLYRRKDGSDLWVNRTVSLVRDSAGHPLYFIRIIEDISERKLAAGRQAMEHSVTRVLAESSTVEQAMPLLIRILCESLGWTCGIHWQWDRNAELLRVANTWHIGAPEIAEFVAFSARTVNEAPDWSGEAPRTNTGGLVRRVWMDGAPVWFPDVTREPGFRRGQNAAQAGLHCAFGFPILAGTGMLGVIEFFSRDIKQPDEALLQVVRAIGSQIGQFIQRKEAEDALRKSEERYHDVFEASPLPMWVWDGETLNLIEVNQAAVVHYGYSRDEFRRMNVRDLWAPGEEKRYEQNISDRTREQNLHLQRRHRTRDGRVIDVEVTARRFSLGGRAVWLTLINDITDRKRAEAALRESEEQFKQLANHIPQVFWITDIAQKETLYVSPAAETLSGLPLSELYGNPRALVRAVHPEDRRRMHAARRTAAIGGYDQIYRVVRPDGTIRWVHDRAFPVHDESGKAYRIAGIAEDVTEKKLAEEQLMQLAHYDVLTRLPNRVLFYDRMKQALAQARRNEWTVGVMFIDLDRFKNVNDTLGHAVGDQLLQQVSGRLSGSVRAGDTVGRLGGDEFSIVLSNLSAAQDANLVAQKIMAAFDEPFKLEGSEIYVTASIGITLYPDDSNDQDTLIKNADAAMYRAKAAGRNSYQFYTSEMNARALENLSLENSLRRALERKEFLLHYQPKAGLDTGAITGFEALLRWKHGDQTVAPGEFIPILEETGLIMPVGEWVIRSVCEQLRLWKQQGLSVKPVAVNLSARQFQQKDLAIMVEQILRETGVAPNLLELELTETMLMTDPEEAARTLGQLKALGVRLAVDDFGTGYSSLAYLKRFPLDALKIDRSFIRDVVSDPDDAAIACTIISLAHNLKLKVVAEGVETEGQLHFVKSNGCDEMQGFYFARPLPVEECGQALIEDRRLPRPQAGVAPDAPVLLLVDDDVNELLPLQRALAAGGFHILTANSAQAGFELLARHRADIVISDHHMPEMTGIEFLIKVRKLYPNAVRVVVSSGDDAPTLTRATNRAGIHKFLSKSWDPERLRAEVREAMKARLEGTAPIAIRPPV